MKKTEVKTSKHHRKCRSHGQGKKGNVVTVKDYQHKSWHALFLNYDAVKIAEIINLRWIDPDYMFIVVKSSDYYAQKRRE